MKVMSWILLKWANYVTEMVDLLIKPFWNRDAYACLDLTESILTPLPKTQNSRKATVLNLREMTMLNWEALKAFTYVANTLNFNLDSSHKQ